MSVEGQLSKREAANLLELSQNLAADSVIVEIGTYRGRSTIALALGSLKGHNNVVYAVDPHHCFRGIYGAEFGPEDQAQLYRNLSRCAVGHIVSVVSLPSLHVALGWPKNNISFLWIDGDHTSEGVQADFHAWYPHVLKGGIIAFHDNYGEGVQSTIARACSERQLELEGEVDSMSWLRKITQDA
jgi:predicted O-methyltransferase YrrM